jgi:hypothetical protein
MGISNAECSANPQFEHLVDGQGALVSSLDLCRHADAHVLGGALHIHSAHVVPPQRGPRSSLPVPECL